MTRIRVQGVYASRTRNLDAPISPVEDCKKTTKQEMRDSRVRGFDTHRWHRAVVEPPPASGASGPLYYCRCGAQTYSCGACKKMPAPFTRAGSAVTQGKCKPCEHGRTPSYAEEKRVVQ